MQDWYVGFRLEPRDCKVHAFVFTENPLGRDFVERHAPSPLIQAVVQGTVPLCAFNAMLRGDEIVYALAGLPFGWNIDEKRRTAVPILLALLDAQKANAVF
jgi:hypothetical protein